MAIFSDIKLCIHVMPNVVNDLHKCQFMENVTSATPWFEPKINILWEKLYLKANFVLTDTGVHENIS